LERNTSNMAPEQAQYVYDPANDPLAIPRNEAAVQHILRTVIDGSDQLDAICEARGWSRVNKETRDILDAFLAGTNPVEDTAERLAAPIDESYTSADAGRQLWEMEMTARACRPQCTPDEVKTFWGDPVAICEPDPAFRNQVSTEGGLGRLWLSINHASRKTPFPGDESGQMLKLVRLVQTLKLRPNPPLPEGATPALLNNWVWKSGKLWSDLTLLGASMRESWNDAPGGTMGFTKLEVKAWERENAFVAHLTVTGTAYYLDYGIWAMRDALEGGIERMNQARCTPEFKAKQLEVTLGVTVVWLSIAGKEMYQQRIETAEPGLVMENGMVAAWRTSTEISDARWKFWKKRLAEFARDETVSASSRSHAVRAGEEMQRLEEAHGEMH
jgi:hypothetical protein